SSGRRHTRFSRDWSSDVCSSDLNALAIAWQVSNDGAAFRYELDAPVQGMSTWRRDAAVFRLPATAHAWLQPMAEPKTGFARTNRSEERRVGKASRSSWRCGVW